ncbi:hypothetical protein KP509_38G047900 [Ceratopteris richardii]|nr:hypothetical protein KP509_38G047900 [Ceratopteris richardii]KAH7278593.1 hypothetical protein KP509_38G047900 [Ceratopteris richardii]KAH7278594.1 hypothetical protein KP509_38G047900 [Ceratopteris richardii]
MQIIASSMTLNSYGVIKTLQTCKFAGHGHGEVWNEEKSRLAPAPIFVEGKMIDLLQLHREVITHGGYDNVTGNSIWSLISERLGFRKNSGSFVQSIYVKYLRSLDYELGMLKDGLHENVGWLDKDVGESSMGTLFGKGVGELSVKTLIAEGVGKSSGGMPRVDCISTGNSCNVSNDSVIDHEEDKNKVPSKKRRLSYSNVSSSHQDCREPGTNRGNAFVDMIVWLRRLALNPGDPSKGQGSCRSFQNKAWVEDCETMIMKARSILWGRNELIDCGGHTGNRAKQKVRPSLYYKEIGKPDTNTLEKLRANQSRAVKYGLHLDARGAIEDTAWLYRTSGQIFGVGGSGQFIEKSFQPSAEYLKSMSEALSIGYLLNSNVTRKRIPIGAHFQAEIPPWTSKTLKSRKCFCKRQQSSEFLAGSCVWPCHGSHTVSHVSSVGKGRPLCCGCILPMSIECVNLHITQKRLKLKREIGDAFFSWGFDDMGESVSVCWTHPEERVFNMIVRSNLSSLGKNFWEELPKALPSKSMKQLVSYYFNVFTVRRRAVQNRITPDSIDSDDDERNTLTSEQLTALGTSQDWILREVG